MCRVTSVPSATSSPSAPPPLQFVAGTKTGKSGPAGFPSLDTIKSTGGQVVDVLACMYAASAHRIECARAHGAPAAQARSNWPPCMLCTC